MAADQKFETFVNAQNAVYPQVLTELQSGKKQTHWMWFIFPQLTGLGHSAMAHKFGIADVAEAKKYLAHPVLGPRLVECVELVLKHPKKDVHTIFGSSDGMKFHSSMTLFTLVDDKSVFTRALDVFFTGKRDRNTTGLLANESPHRPTYCVKGKRLVNL